MPNRILKQSICTSPNVNSLSMGAETLFYRLIVQCDDFGQFYANPAILRGLCYPLRLKKITEGMVSDWLAELVAANLIWTYDVESVTYLQFTKWEAHQQIRATKRKYPQPLPVIEPVDDSPTVDFTGNQVKSTPAEGQSAPNTNTSTNTNTVSNTNTGASASETPKHTPTKSELTLEPLEILLFRTITGSSPPVPHEKRIIELLRGKTFETANPYFEQWLTVSKNHNNLTWVLEWIASGRPSDEFGANAKKGANHAGNPRNSTPNYPTGSAKPVDPTRPKIKPFGT